MMFSFEKLEVWQKSRYLVKAIYNLTNNFPVEERYGLTSQLRRAAISVSSNIAEGSTRHSYKDKARFYEIAYGSLIEIMNQIILSMDLQYLQGDVPARIATNIEELSKMLSALYNSAKAKSTRKTI